MTTELLRKKTGRYLCGMSMPAEKRQIQTWLSCITDDKPPVKQEEREAIENEIVSQVQAYVISTLPDTKQEHWWKKITAIF